MSKLDELAKAALDELVSEFALPSKQPGDLTLPEIANGMKITVGSARDRMKKKIKDGLWHTVKVYDPNTNKSIKVYRKGKKPNGLSE